MTDEQIQNILKTNYRVMALLGIATRIIHELSSSNPDQSQYYWFMQAIEAVICDDKPIPPLPGN